MSVLICVKSKHGCSSGMIRWTFLVKICNHLDMTTIGYSCMVYMVCYELLFHKLVRNIALYGPLLLAFTWDTCKRWLILAKFLVNMVLCTESSGLCTFVRESLEFLWIYWLVITWITWNSWYLSSNSCQLWAGVGKTVDRLHLVNICVFNTWQSRGFGRKTTKKTHRDQLQGMHTFSGFLRIQPPYVCARQVKRSNTHDNSS